MSGFGSKSASTYSTSVPQHYIAGLGRGATGFTTRSDIGPARPAVGATAAPGTATTIDPQFGAAPVGYVAGRGRGMGDLARGQGELPQKAVDVDPDRGDYSESNYDEFAGYSGGLFSAAGTPYEEDDAEADQIYDMVDEFMDGRHKRRREQQMLEAQKNRKNNRPKITEQFADLKRDLATVTADQWDAIPEVGDHSLKLKQTKKKETFMPLPDYLLEGASQRGGVLGQTVNEKQGGGDGSGAASTVTGMAEARGAVLTLKLDKMSDSVSGQTVVDPKGYLTDLNSIRVNTDAEVVDIKKAETLLHSVTSTNPKHAPGWVAAARVQEFAGRIVQARKVIREGCEICPDSEDVWLEAARLHTADNAKTILANAVRHIPTSVKIWLQATELETSDEKKKIVLRRALEFIPNSVKLWKTAIELESVSDAKIMLARAVECVPHSVEMWLALAKLETHENARKVLNQAREALPTEPLTWITAARLEEAHGTGKAVVDRIIEKMMASLSQYEVVIGREQWLREAEACEAAGALLTCAAIVRNTIQVGVEEEDRLATWMDDAETCLSHTPAASVHTARAIYNYSLEMYPNKRTLWLAACVLEKDHGTAESLESTLLAAVKHCPHAEVLWLMAAKEKWLSGSVPGARAILLEAFEANPQSEQIWLAAVKLEWENNETSNAQALLTKARDMAPSPRVWLKSALLERELHNNIQALAFLETAIKKYPKFAKFYMMAGQICCNHEGSQNNSNNNGNNHGNGSMGMNTGSSNETALSSSSSASTTTIISTSSTSSASSGVLIDYGRAREYYQKGLLQCPDNAVLWCLSIRLEEQLRGVNKARSMAEMARLKLPTDEKVWLESIQLERRSGHEKLAESVAAKALKQCPLSGLLWAEEILTCSKTAQKQKSMEALKKCDSSPEVITAVARLFERDRKHDKARKWFERAVALNLKLGDSWVYLYAFELKQLAIASNKSQSSQQPAAMNSSNIHHLVDDVLTRCIAAEPNQGELWCATAKHTQYRRAGAAAVLKKIAQDLLLSSSSSSSTVTSNNSNNTTNAISALTGKDSSSTDMVNDEKDDIADD